MSKECIVYSLLHVEQLFLLYAADNWHVCYFLWNYSSVTWRWRIRDNQSKSEFLPLNSFVLFRGLFYDTSSSLRLDWSSSLVGQRYKLQQKLNNSSHIGIQKEFWLNDVWGSRSQTTYVYSVWKEWGLWNSSFYCGNVSVSLCFFHLGSAFSAQNSLYISVYCVKYKKKALH